jgi:hypothetical protein
MTSNDDLRAALREWLFPKGFTHPGHWSLTNEGAAAIARAALARPATPPLDWQAALTEHDRQASMGSHLFDESCPLCRPATPPPASAEADAGHPDPETA